VNSPGLETRGSGLGGFGEQLRRAHAELQRAAQEWVSVRGRPVTLRVIPFDAPGGPGIEVIPDNPRAAKVLLSLETAQDMVLHLGRNSWWDRLEPEPQLIRTILDAVSHGRFKEMVRLCCGRAMTSHGQLELANETWNDRGFGLPIGRRVVEEYESY
jgi:hypothetical protein